jgi:hypothetical protein
LVLKEIANLSLFSKDACQKYYRIVKTVENFDEECGCC